mgnify:CR=1 FL=1
MSFFKGKTSKRTCGLCGHELHGVPHGKTVVQVSKLSKTEKRPSTIFGGVLCTKCRTLVVEDAAKIKTGVISLSDVSFKEKNFVEMALPKVGE